MLNPGSVVGDASHRYQIVRALDRGGMGEVYEATQQQLARRVALKTNRTDLASRPELLARFRREAEAAAALGHPNIGRLEPGRAAFIAVQLLSGLASAHRAGQVLGTLAYVAPEQAVSGAAVDGRTDVFGVGATLFHALSGVRPFEATEPGVGRAPLERIAPWVNRELAAVILPARRDGPRGQGHAHRARRSRSAARAPHALPHRAAGGGDGGRGDPRPPLSSAVSPRAAHSARRVLVASVALGLTMLARDATASPTSRLVYVRGAGAESCPDEPEMRRAVATRLGYDPFRPLAQTTLTAEIRRENGVFRGRVKLVDDAGVERGARDLESRAADCRDLTTAMALSMSIAIDPLSMMRPPPESSVVLEEPVSPAPVPVPVPPPGTDAAPAESPAPTPPATDPLRLALAAATHVGFGTAPAPSLGFRLSAEAATRRFSIGLEGRLDLPASSETSEGGRSRTSLAGASVVPCVRVPLAWACGVVLVARVSADAVVTSPREEGFLFLGAGARLVSTMRLPEDFSLRIGGDVLAHPIPFELTVNGRSIYRSSTVSALAGIGLARIF